MKYLKRLVEQSTVGDKAKTYVGKRVKYSVFQGYLEEAADIMWGLAEEMEKEGL